MKILDENFKQFKCVICVKDNFATKQCMLGVKKIKQLKSVIRDKADFATELRMLGERFSSKTKIFV